MDFTMLFIAIIAGAFFTALGCLGTLLVRDIIKQKREK
jgi:hypothetical protein